MKTHYHPKFGIDVLNITAGEHYVCKNKHIMITTILGSCVAACAFDPIKKIAGMNHFMLPISSNNNLDKMRYGHHAMEVLINDMLVSGAIKSNIVLKVFGGANVNRNISKNIGRQNVEFIREWAVKENFPIIAEDLDGEYARRIYFNTLTGKVNRLMIGQDKANIVFHKEETTQNTIPQYGDVELFD